MKLSILNNEKNIIIISKISFFAFYTIILLWNECLCPCGEQKSVMLCEDISFSQIVTGFFHKFFSSNKFVYFLWGCTRKHCLKNHSLLSIMLIIVILKLIKKLDVHQHPLINSLATCTTRAWMQIINTYI